MKVNKGFQEFSGFQHFVTDFELKSVCSKKSKNTVATVFPTEGPAHRTDRRGGLKPGQVILLVLDGSRCERSAASLENAQSKSSHHLLACRLSGSCGCM